GGGAGGVARPGPATKDKPTRPAANSFRVRFMAKSPVLVTLVRAAHAAFVLPSGTTGKRRHDFLGPAAWAGNGCGVKPRVESAEPGDSSSRQDGMDDLAVYVRQPHVAAAEAHRQALVVDAQEVQQRRVQVVDLHLVLHRLVAPLVGGPVGDAALHAAAGQ